MIADRRNQRILASFLVVMLLVVWFPYPAKAQTPASQQQVDADRGSARSADSATETGERTPSIPTKIIEKSAKGLGQQLQNMHDKASLDLGFWGVTWLGLITFLLALVLVAIVDRVVRALLRRQLRVLKSAEKPRTTRILFLEAFSGPLSLLIWVYGMYAALSILLVQLHETAGTKLVQATASRAADLGGAIAIVWLAYRLVILSDVQVKEWAGKSESKIDELLASIVGKALRIAVILIGSVMVIQNFTDIRMGPLIASLGLGGLAIALAAKDYLANFLGTLTLIFDKPFQIGDQVAVDKYEGAVESVGFRSTRIRTAEGHLLSIPNSKMIDSPLQNVTRRPNIRWQTTIAISCENPPEKVKLSIEILEDTFRNHEGMSENLPPRVFFDSFKECSLSITIVAWYHPPNWWEYEAWRQKTCLAILERFQAEGIMLAVPTQLVHVAGDGRKQFGVPAGEEKL